MAEEKQLVDQDGHFNERGIDAYMKALNLAVCGLSYAVVSIMGPQSSGKSTLLNHLFHTNFREMDAFRGRSQTTKGIWLARGVDIDPCTLVMDLEGSDGSERGEDDTIFEKQSALFALAVSDIVLINLWYHDIGREHAANKPLLKTVFQAMTRLFSPRKTTLLFVIRDISKTPLELLEKKLREDIQKIWVSVHKPEAYRETPLGEIFNVEVVALSNYEEKEEKFKEQVASLRQRFYHSIAPGGLAGDRQTVVPAAEFFFSAKQIWKVIKENKDLNLPAHKVMVATVRCEEIANEKFAGFSSDEEWRQLEESVQHGLIPLFGQTLSLLLDKFLSGYDMEVQYFDDGVRTQKRKQLESKLLQLAYPAYQSMLGHLRSKTVDDFKEAFDKALQRGEGFAVAVRDCTQSLMSVFDVGCEEAVLEQAKLDCLKVREKVRGNIVRDINAHVASVRADKLSELKAKYEGQLNKALVEPVGVLLEAASNNRLSLVSPKPSSLCPSFQALKVLSVMSAIRMDDNIDNIGHTLSLALLSAADNGIQSDDVLASSSWEKVEPTRTLVTPLQCLYLWTRFIERTNVFVIQAMATQEANRQNNNLRRVQEANNRQNNILGYAGLVVGIVSTVVNIATGGIFPQINPQ